jgi:hypothetical protein
MNESTQIGLSMLAAVLVFGVFFIGFMFGIDNLEVIRCNELKEMSEKYPDFYITSWQKSMCDYHEIKISAPVK